MAPTDLPPEFALIARHFRPLAGPGALNLTDDAAVIAPPPGRELVLTVDAMVETYIFCRTIRQISWRASCCGLICRTWRPRGRRRWVIC